MPIRQRKRNCFEHAGQVATQKGIGEGIFAQLSGSGLRQGSLLHGASEQQTSGIVSIVIVSQP